MDASFFTGSMIYRSAGIKLESACKNGGPFGSLPPSLLFFNSAFLCETLWNKKSFVGRGVTAVQEEMDRGDFGGGGGTAVDGHDGMTVRPSEGRAARARA